MYKYIISVDAINIVFDSGEILTVQGDHENYDAICKVLKEEAHEYLIKYYINKVEIDAARRLLDETSTGAFLESDIKGI